MSFVSLAGLILSTGRCARASFSGACCTATPYVRLKRSNDIGAELNTNSFVQSDITVTVSTRATMQATARTGPRLRVAFTATSHNATSLSIIQTAPCSSSLRQKHTGQCKVGCVVCAGIRPVLLGSSQNPRQLSLTSHWLDSVRTVSLLHYLTAHIN